MRKSFYFCLLTTATVVGSVIGAGFITGKEIYEFFAKDFSLGGVYIAFICFWLFTFLMMQKPAKLKAERFADIVVAIVSVVISGCMISALDETYKRMFHLTEKVKILSIITAILVFFMSLKGIAYIEKVCVLLIPIVIVVLIVFAFIKTDGYGFQIIPKKRSGISYPIIYCGVNLLLSSKIIKNSGEKLSPPFKLLSSFFISFILFSCVFVLSNILKNAKSNLAMPFRTLFENDIKLLIIVDIITVFAIITTLFSSVYTSIRFGGVKLNFKYKIIILLLSIALSEIGFSVIVEKLYPVLGIVGYLVVFITCLLPALFPKWQQEHTFHLLKHKG